MVVGKAVLFSVDTDKDTVCKLKAKVLSYYVQDIHCITYLNKHFVLLPTDFET